MRIAFDCDKALFLVEHTPEGGEKPNENMRTFYFGKSRSQLIGKAFHMLKMDRFPCFEAVTLPAGKTRK